MELAFCRHSAPGCLTESYAGAYAFISERSTADRLGHYGQARRLSPDKSHCRNMALNAPKASFRESRFSGPIRFM